MYTAQPPPPPPPPSVPYQAPPNAPQSSGRPPQRTTWILLAVGVLLLVGAIGTAVVLVVNAGSNSASGTSAGDYGDSTGDDGIEGEPDYTSDGSGTGDGSVETSDTTSSSDSSSASDQSGSSSTSSSSTEPPATVKPTSHALQASSISASATRESVSSLRCTKQPLAYDAENLLDGDPQTGWGASKSDGTGQSVRVSFAGSVHLKRVGITPGYFRVAPRSASACATVNAYEFNRKITGVRYTFDDGTTVEQRLSDNASIQYVAADVETQSVTITILGTVRPAEADDDTIISDAYFEGY